jgi:phage baseplate assembly protein W
MTSGIPTFSNGAIQQITGGDNGDLSGPDAYEKLLPNALDDVCIEFSRASSVDKLFGYNAINNMMVNVLYTRIGERDFEPEFGSNTVDLLQEPNDDVNAEIVEIEIYDQLRRWVPYIDITISGIIVQPIPEQQLFRIAFVYKEISSGITRTFAAFISKSGITT